MPSFNLDSKYISKIGIAKYIFTICNASNSRNRFQYFYLFVIVGIFILTSYGGESFVVLNYQKLEENKIRKNHDHYNQILLSSLLSSSSQHQDSLVLHSSFLPYSSDNTSIKQYENKKTLLPWSPQLMVSDLSMPRLYQFLISFSIGYFLSCYPIDYCTIVNAVDMKSSSVRTVQPLEKLPSLPGSSTVGNGNGESGQRGYQNEMSQIEQAMPLKSIRGIWRIREYRPEKVGNSRNSQTYLYKGRLKFQGFVDEPLKGKLVYKRVPKYSSPTAPSSFSSSTVVQPSLSSSLPATISETNNNVQFKNINNDNDNDSNEILVTGKGNWLLKPARIVNGQIQFSARWKVKYTDGTTLIYRGDVKTFSNGRNEDTNYSKAFASITDGEVLEPYKDAFGGLAERKIGYFEADLIEKIDDEEKL